MDAEFLKEEESSNDRYRQTDEAVRLQRVFPPGTVVKIRTYEPSGSGYGAVAVSGERLSKLILGAREMYRCVPRVRLCEGEAPCVSSVSVVSMSSTVSPRVAHHMGQVEGWGLQS